jgi:hypothetical protein
MTNLSAANALLLGPNDGIFFVPSGPGFDGQVSLTVCAWDGSAASTHYTDGSGYNLSKKGSTGGTTPFSLATAKTELTANLYFNAAPTQTPPASPIPFLPAGVPENAPSRPVSVATLLKDVGAADADRETLGMALTGVTGNGTWQYELPHGVWQNVPATLLGGVGGTPPQELSDAAALLLPGTALLRFDPTTNQSGPATLTWNAWDGTENEPEALATGGATAFSTASATATLTVDASTHPPAWYGSGAALTPVLPTDTNPPGNTVASVFGGYFEDGTLSPGIAVSGVAPTTLGQWQYRKAGDTSWTTLASGSVNPNQALLLSANDMIRFVPNGKGGVGTATLTAYAWDGMGIGDSAGSKVRPRGSDFSTTTLTATCLVNTAPELTA